MRARPAALAGRALPVLAVWAIAWAAAGASPSPARPAQSGGQGSAATAGPLAIGSTVKDRTGATVGHIVRVTTDKNGVSVAQIRQGEDVYAVPVTDLTSLNGEVVSMVTLADLRRRGGAAFP